MGLNINLNSPSGFLPLLLFLGVALVLMGSVQSAIMADSSLTNLGWITVVGSVALWVIFGRHRN
jgi:hypothetical protein